MSIDRNLLCREAELVSSDGVLLRCRSFGRRHVSRSAVMVCNMLRLLCFVRRIYDDALRRLEGVAVGPAFILLGGRCATRSRCACGDFGVASESTHECLLRRQRRDALLIVGLPRERGGRGPAGGTTRRKITGVAGVVFLRRRRCVRGSIIDIIFLWSRRG